MTTLKIIILFGVLTQVGVSLPWVLAGSIIFGLIGGWSAAKRQNMASVGEIINEAISMALFGCSISMAGYWYFEDDDRIGFVLIAVSGLCGLVGSSIFKPLSSMLVRAIETIAAGLDFNFLTNLIKRMLKTDGDRRDDSNDDPRRS